MLLFNIRIIEEKYAVHVPESPYPILILFK
jgi:hypothetical protein